MSEPLRHYSRINTSQPIPRSTRRLPIIIIMPLIILLANTHRTTKQQWQRRYILSIPGLTSRSATHLHLCRGQIITGTMTPAIHHRSGLRAADANVGGISPRVMSRDRVGGTNVTVRLFVIQKITQCRTILAGVGGVITTIGSGGVCTHSNPPHVRPPLTRRERLGRSPHIHLETYRGMFTERPILAYCIRPTSIGPTDECRVVDAYIGNCRGSGPFGIDDHFVVLSFVADGVVGDCIRRVCLVGFHAHIITSIVIGILLRVEYAIVPSTSRNDTAIVDHFTLAVG
mmetsp:Transcript_9929/g.22287  ORF Transcript_9929/g.22287 Transcript_9929/m.22287 type:complete len:286 (-) Transcript_9929:1766-2623(-)